MKIAILTSSFPLDPDDPAAAAGLFVRDFAVALAKLNTTVHVITQDKGFGCINPPSEISVDCYSWGGGNKALSQLNLLNPLDLKNAYQLIGNAKRFLGKLHQHVDFDHVLAMWAVPAGLIANSLRKSNGVPFSVWCLGSDIWAYGKMPILKKVVANVIRNSTHRFADGIQLGLEAEKLAGCPIQFLPSSRKLDVDAYRTGNLNGPSPRFLFIGRYAEVKGIDILIKAFKRLRQSKTTASLFLLGGGPMRESIIQQVNENDLKDCVTVGDFANAETVIRFGKACDAIVIPSRMESIPVVLSDAMQMKKPVIVSDVGDMGEIVRDAGAGLVVPPNDPNALSQAMIQFCQQGPDAFSQGIARLAKRFDVDQTAKEFLAQIQRQHNHNAPSPENMELSS